MWTDKNINLSDSVPSFFGEIYEYQQLFAVLSDEIYLLQQYMINLKDDLFLTTASEKVISRYQNLLKTSGLSTEQKRANIIAKFSETVPFGINSLKKFVNTYLENECRIDTSTDGKVFAYYTGKHYITDEKSFYTNAYNILPANLQFEIEYYYAKYKDYLLNIYEDFTQKTWAEVKSGL